MLQQCVDPNHFHVAPISNWLFRVQNRKGFQPVETSREYEMPLTSVLERL